MKIKATTRRWGNSIAVVIPRDVATRQRIREDQSIIITIEEERPMAKEFFGLGAGKLGRSTQEIKNQMRKGWETASDKAS